MSDLFTLSLTPTDLALKAGENHLLTLSIQNHSEEMAHYLLRSEGEQSGWLTLDSEQLAAFPLQTLSVSATLSVPADAYSQRTEIALVVELDEREGTRGQTRLALVVQGRTRSAPPTPLPQSAADEPLDHAPSLEPVPARQRRTDPTDPDIGAASVYPAIRAEQPAGAATPRAKPATVAETPNAARPQPVLKIRAEPVAEHALPSPAAQWALTLHNEGPELDSFGFRVVGIPPAWFHVAPVQLALHPGEQGRATLTVQPPDDAPARHYAFDIIAFSVRDIMQSSRQPLELEVPSRVAYQLKVSPNERESAAEGRFRIMLSSDAVSNTPLRLRLVASDQDDGCDFEWEREELMLAPQEQQTVALRVTPRRSLSVNERRMHKLLVAAQPERADVADQTAELRLIQVGAPPPVLTLQPEQQRGSMSAAYDLLLTNPAPIPYPLTLHVSDPAAQFSFSMEPARLELAPQSQRRVQIHLRARSPRLEEDEASHPFSVVARAEGQLVPIAEAGGRFVQLPRSPLGAELRPQQQSSPGKATFHLRLSNPREEGIAVTLEASDEQDALNIHLDPPSLHLPPDGVAQIKIEVQPKDKLMEGEQRRVHRFEVRRLRSGRPPRTLVTGKLAQTRGRKWWSGLSQTLRLSSRLARWAVALILILLLVTVTAATVEEIAYANGAGRAAGRVSCSAQLPLAYSAVTRNDPNLGRLLRTVAPPPLVCAPLDWSPLGNPTRTVVRAISDFVQPFVVP
ncbi:MAG: hypothetical protein KDD73_00455 [Anaerolineales bacterium]|nr:hypothetical protein [Anaerolineales bacterium]MCB9128381.1 hypothetical protein [Ardenticatenales bacterium]